MIIISNQTEYLVTFACFITRYLKIHKYENIIIYCYILLFIYSYEHKNTAEGQASLFASA